MVPNLTLKQWALSHLIIISILVLIIVQYFNIIECRLSVAFLDIGQGDAILIQTPEYKNILIDAGMTSVVVDRLGEQLSFFDKTIDLFIITHPDRDHYAGVLDIMQKYKIKQIMLTGIANPDRLYEAFLAEARKQKVPIIFPQNNQDLKISHKIYLDILYPFAGQSLVGQIVKNKNTTSIVMRLLRQRSENWENLIMLTGDAEHSQERELVLSGQELSGNILKLGHHGAKTSTSDIFLSAIKPQITVVSAGKDNKFGHPHPITMEKVKDLEIRQTLQEGSIKFNF